MSERKIESPISMEPSRTAISLRNRISLLVREKKADKTASRLVIDPLFAEEIRLKEPTASLGLDPAVVQKDGVDIQLPSVSVRVDGKNEIDEEIHVDYTLVFDNHGNWLPDYSVVTFGSETDNNQDARTHTRVSGWDNLSAALDLAFADDSGTELQMRIDPKIDNERLAQIEVIVEEFERYFAH
jgi:hypothetical protein